MNTSAQEPAVRPASINWAFYAALLALGTFTFLAVLQIFQTYNPNAAALMRQNLLKTHSDGTAPLGIEEVQGFIPSYRIGIVIWITVIGCLYLTVAFSFRRGHKVARTAAAVLALISVVGLFSPSYLSSLWVLLNSVSAALLFTRSSAVFFARQPKNTTTLSS